MEQQPRHMTLFFNDGTQMTLAFPKQVKHDESIPVRLERLLEKDSLLIESDGALLLIPRSSIKYLQVSPAPNILPDYVIKGASLTA
jgi:hypothetical protein